jgi:hypothetical protein
MGAHVIWFGPVSREQRSGATVDGATEHFVSCTGDGSGGTPRCRALAESYGSADGRRLPGLLRQLGIPEGEDLYFGAFSAGGSAVKVLLAHPDDRAAVRAVMLADGTYELRGPDQKPAPSPSFVEYAVETLDGSRMFVATASSSPNVRLGVAEPSGSETLERLAADIEARSGSLLDVLSYIPGVDEFHPARVWTKGGVVLADFGNQFRHPEHATRIAPVLWPRLLQPRIDQGWNASTGNEEVADSATRAGGAGALLALAAVFGAFWWFSREPRPPR